MCDSIDEVSLQVSLRVIRGHTDTSQEKKSFSILSVHNLLFLFSVTVVCLILVHTQPGVAHWERFGADP